MSAEVETAIMAEAAAWWDRDNEHVFGRTMTKEEAWEAGGINWPVELVPVEFNGEDTGYNLIVRGTDDSVLGFGTDSYAPLQNWDLLTYAEALVRADGELEFESAMSLKDGKVVAVCARKPEGITIAGDEHIPYLTAANWHDRSRSAHIFFSGIRTECWNTLNYGIEDAPNVFRFRHTGSMEEKLERARHELEVGFKYLDAVKEMGDELALQPMTPQEFDRFLKAALPDPPEKDRKWAKKQDKPDPLVAVMRSREKLIAVCNDTPDLQNHRLNGNITAWGALQGTIAYNDHHRNFQSPDTRFEAAVLEKNDMTERAVSFLTAS